MPIPALNYRKLRSDGQRLYLLDADSTLELRTSLRTQVIESPVTPQTPLTLLNAPDPPDARYAARTVRSRRE